MKRVCVLLEGSINRDSRAQRTVRSMARLAEVHAWFHTAAPERVAGDVVGGGAALHPVVRPPTRLDRVLAHSAFFAETRYLGDAALDAGHRYDLVYAHDLATTFAAARIARRHRARLVYDVHDLAIETLNQLFPPRAPLPKQAAFATIKRVMSTLGRTWERHFARRADLVITTNPSYADYLRRQYGLDRLMDLPNYPELREVTTTDALYRDLGLPGDTALILYHGVLGPGRSLELVVESAAGLAAGRVLVLIGHGPLEPRLRALAERAGADRVRFVPHVPYERLFDYASGASIGLALIEPINLSKRLALANKVTEYMASGVPVLASDCPENVRLVTSARCGFISSFSSPGDLAAYLNRITEDRAALAELGAAGRQAFRQRFNWNAHEPRFAEAIGSLLA